MKKHFKIILMVLLICSCTLSLIGCGTKSKQVVKDNKDSNEITFTDGLGNEISVSTPKHVAVLTGSLAEAWLLAGGELAAVTNDISSERTVELPEDIVDLGLLESPNTEAMINAGVDFAILSANLTSQVKLKSTLEKAGITTAYFNVETFDDYLGMLKIMTDITGKSDLYKKNGTDIQSIIDTQIKRADGSAPTVLFIRAYSGGAKAKGSDNMTGHMLKDLGCVNIADSDESILEDLSVEKIIQDDPDYIFVTTMGDSEEEAMKVVEDTLVSNPAWKELSAVKNDRYFVLPKALFHYKPNNRWGESYTMLADILYGDKK